MIRLPRPKINLTPGIIALLTIVLGITAYFAEIPFLEVLDLKTVDMRFMAREKIAPTGHVVLVTIDEKSLEKEGKWMWPRAKFADLVRSLDKMGARVIAFDIGFLEKDNPQLLNTLKAIQDRVRKENVVSPDLTTFLEDIQRKSDNDRLLAEAIRDARAQVVLGHFFILEEEMADIYQAEDLAREGANLANARYKIVRYAPGAPEDLNITRAAVAQANIAPLANAAPYAGYFNILPDIDGVYRHMPMAIQYRQEIYAPLSLTAVSAYLNKPLTLFVSAEGGIESLRIGDLVIPTDEKGRLTINYRGPAKTFRHLSVTDVLHQKIPAAEIADKIVFVGPTATAAHDMRVTPVGGEFPGVEVHANVADSVLADDLIYQPPWEVLIDLLAIALITAVLYFVLPRLGVIWGMAITALMITGYIYACIHLFAKYGLILNMVFSLIVAGGGYVTLTANRYFNETRQKRRIREMFSTYVAPPVVQQLIESPNPLELGGEERHITAFFSDVVGFTTIAEKLTPKVVVELLNDFLTEMTDIILNHMGTVDKFEGDAIIALFGAPNELENKARAACQACLEMDQRLNQMRAQWRSEGRPELHMRIGMSTGPAVVGNMGSRNRMDYTMMGDTVNTASRLEQANKLYGTRMLINQETFQEAGTGFAYREIDRVLLFGKSEPVTIYELLGYADGISVQVLEGTRFYAKGLAAYRASDWERATYFFQQALEQMPDDGPSQTLLRRIGIFKNSPPPDDWQGAFKLTSK